MRCSKIYALRRLTGQSNYLKRVSKSRRLTKLRKVPRPSKELVAQPLVPCLVEEQENPVERRELDQKMPVNHGGEKGPGGGRSSCISAHT